MMKDVAGEHMRIDLRQFRGIRPTIDAKSLPELEAQTAHNCKLRSGALQALSGDLPSATPPAFNFTDGFGTWTLAGGKLCLDGVEVNQATPGKPTVTSVAAFSESSVGSTTFAVGATVAAGVPATQTSATPGAQLTTFELTGSTLRLVYTVQPTFIGILCVPGNAITGQSQSASLTINGTAFSVVGTTGALAGGVGTLKLEQFSLSPCTFSIKYRQDSSGSYLYASSWTATYEFSINYNTALAIERASTYRVTHVETNGMESPASDPSNLLILKPNQYAVLALDGSKINRIYRAAGPTADAAYYFVAEVAAGTATYNDLVADADLGEVMPEIENPPTTLTQIVWIPGGFLAGFYGKDIYFSDPFMLYSWNSENTLTTLKTIVGLAVNGNDLYALCAPPTGDETDAKNQIITGVTPDVMTMSELAVNEGCSSRNSICKVGSTVGFASPSGFIVIAGGSGKNITEPFYNRSQWSALGPSAMICKEYDNAVVCFTSGTAGVIVDYINGMVTTFTGSGAGNFTWKSKLWEWPQPIEFHALQVQGEAGTHTVKLYADGVEVYSGTVTTNTDVRLTRGMTAGRRWELQISGSTKVDNIGLIHRERIMVNGPMLLTKDQVEGCWKGLLFRIPDTGRFKVVRCRASDYNVTAAFYRDTTSDSTQTLTGDTDTRLTGQTDNDLWEVDLTGAGEFYELLLVPRAVETVIGPISLRNQATWKGKLFQFPGRGTFKVGRIRGADGAVTGTLNFYANESASATKTVNVTTDVDFRINDLGNMELVEVEFIPTDQTTQVDELFLVPRTVETVTGPILLKDRATWKGLVFQFPDKGTFKVGRLRGPAGVVTGTLNFYADESEAATKSIAVTTDTDFRITGVAGAELVEVEFVPTDQTIKCDELLLVPRTVQTVTGPVVLSKQGRATWLGNVFYFPRKGWFRVARARGAPGATLGTLALRSDETDVATLTQVLSNDTDLRLTETTPNDLWEVEVTGNGELDELILWPQAFTEVQTPVVHVARATSGAPATWLANEFQFPENVRLRSAIVKAPSYASVVLKVWCGGVAVNGSPYTVTNANEFRLTLPASVGRRWEFDLESTGQVDEVTLFFEQEILAGQAAAHLRYDGVQGQVSTLARVIRFKKDDYFACAKVRASSYPVRMKMYRDREQNPSVNLNVENDAGFWLPKVDPAATWEVDVILDAGILYEVALAKSMSGLRG